MMPQSILRHEYQIQIPVTKINRKGLERDHGKTLLVGDTLVIPVNYFLPPTPTQMNDFRIRAQEFGGYLKHRTVETISSDWGSI